MRGYDGTSKALLSCCKIKEMEMTVVQESIDEGHAQPFNWRARQPLAAPCRLSLP